MKYTINFDGMFASFATIHSGDRESNESVVLPQNVMGHFQKVKAHSSVYILDRGQNSAEAFKAMKSDEGLLFVGRLTGKRKLLVVEDLKKESDVFTDGELLEDKRVKLYKREEKLNKEERQ